VGYHMVAGTIEQLRRLQEDHWARFSEQRAPTPTQLRQFMEKQRSPPPAYLVPWLLRSVSLRGQVRQVQRLTALHHALVLQPDSPQIHRNLADVYWQMCYYDLSLE